MTHKDEKDFKSADSCHICDKKYVETDLKVRDHCHITRKYRGSAHQDCHLKLKIGHETIKIPVIFHNLRGYDNHFVMQIFVKLPRNILTKTRKEKAFK